VIDVGDNHRRMIGVTLGMLDTMLCQFEILIDGAEIHSALYRRICRLTPQQKRGIREQSSQIRLLLSQIRDELGLEPQQEDVATMIWSQASCFWQNLVELEGDGLRGYGAVSPQLQAYLTPRVQELNRRLQEIARLVSSRASTGTG